jgi:hypothetical protein
LNEVEFFVELLDEQNADRVLHRFKETVPGFKNPKLEQKKNHIRLMFKKQTSVTRRFKHDPFYTFISGYKMKDSLKNLTETEFFITLAGIDSIPDCVKFVFALREHPQKTRELLPQLVNNYENGRPIFSMFEDYNTFNTKEELIEYWRKSSTLMGEAAAEVILDRIEHYMPDEAKGMVNELKKIIEPLSLVDYVRRFKELRHDYPMFLFPYVFVLTHPNEERDVKLALSIDGLIKVFEEFEENVRKTATQDTKDRIAIEEKEKKIKTLTDKLNSAQETIREMRTKHKDLEKQLEESYTQIRVLKKQLTQLVKDKEAIQNTYEEKLKVQAKEHQQRLKQIHKEKEDAFLKLQMLKTEESNHRSPFAIIHTFDSSIFQEFYPEVVSLMTKDWRSKHQVLLQKNIRYLCIQRNGISNNMLTEIRKFCKENNIEDKIFYANNIKEVFEQIGFYKHILGGK